MIKKPARLSVKLTAQEIKELKAFCEKNEPMQVAADKIKISRPTLLRVLLVGSGKQETIRLVRKQLK